MNLININETFVKNSSEVSNTVTSLELVNQINEFRKLEKEDFKELQHKSLLAIIRDEFEDEIQEQKILPLSYEAEVGNGAKKKLPMFNLTYSQAKQVLVRESKFVRRHVIQRLEELESKLSKELSPAEFLVQQANLLLDQERRLKAVMQRQDEQAESLKILEVKVTTRNDDYFTVAGYASYLGKSVNLQEAIKLGKRATKLSNERGASMGTINDPRFGFVRTYQSDVLKEVFHNFTKNC